MQVQSISINTNAPTDEPINKPKEESPSNKIFLPNVILLSLCAYHASSTRDLMTLSGINKQFRHVVKEFYQRSPALCKLMSVGSHILGDPAIFRISFSLAKINQFIAYIADSRLQILDVVQGKRYSFYPGNTSTQKIWHIFNERLAFIDVTEPVIHEHSTKINYFQLGRETETLNPDFFDFIKRRPNWDSYYIMEENGKLVVVANKKSANPSDSFIDIVDVENKTAIFTEDQDARQFEMRDILIDQNTLYIAYINWNAPNRGNYSNLCDVVKTYSLTTGDILHSYPCSFPKKILVTDTSLVISQDNLFIQIFDKKTGVLKHTINPTDKKDHEKMGYVCSLLLHQNQLIAGLEDNRIKIFSVETAQLLKTIDLNLLKIHQTSSEGWCMERIALDNRYMAVVKNPTSTTDSSKKAKILIFDLKSYLFVYAFEAEAPISQLKFSEEQLIANLENGQIEVWDTRWPEEIEEINLLPSSPRDPIQDPIEEDDDEEVAEEKFKPVPLPEENNIHPIERERIFIQILNNWTTRFIALIRAIAHFSSRFFHWFRQLAS